MRHSDFAYVNDVRAAVELKTPRTARMLLLTITAMLVVGLIWANFAILDEVKRGDGRVIPSQQMQVVQTLEGGIVLNFGTAVMGPEVYLKALAMARNVAHQRGERIAKFTTAVFDLIPLGDDYHTQAPKTDPRYYYRPWKTILVRTVADGGESFYVAGDHRETIPAVWKAAVG